MFFRWLVAVRHRLTFVSEEFIPVTALTLSTLFRVTRYPRFPTRCSAALELCDVSPPPAREGIRSRSRLHCRRGRGKGLGRESSWARAARRLARNASVRSSTSAIRRCSASGGRGITISDAPAFVSLPRVVPVTKV